MYLKQRLAAGQRLIGAGIFSGSPDVIEYTAVGMDWIWWEAQHAHPDWQTLVHGVRTAYGMRIPALVRTWTHEGGTIERLLDTGAEGIIVPLVDTPEQAEESVSRCYYPPFGKRSYGAIRMERIKRLLVTYRNVEPARGEVKLRVGQSPGTWAWRGDLPGLAGAGGESHFLELEYDACGWHGDYGYSGWVQFEDGEIFCVYHHRDAAPKSYIRGCWFREEEFAG